MMYGEPFVLACEQALVFGFCFGFHSQLLLSGFLLWSASEFRNDLWGSTLIKIPPIKAA